MTEGSAKFTEGRVQLLETARTVGGVIERFATPLYAAVIIAFLLVFIVAAHFLTVEADEAWILLSTMNAFGIPLPQTDALATPTLTSGGMHLLIHGALASITSSVFVHRLVSLLFTALLLAMVFRALKRMDRTTPIALAGTALFAAMPGLIFQASLATPEIIATLLLIWACLHWVRRGQSSNANALVSGILFGLSCATRVNCVVALPAILIYALFSRSNSRPHVFRALLTVATAAAVLALAMAAYYFAARSGNAQQAQQFFAHSAGVGGAKSPSQLIWAFVISDRIMPLWLVAAIGGAYLISAAEGAGSQSQAEPARISAILLLIGLAGVAAWEHLERFHYKTSLESLASEADSIQRVGGRKAVLLMYLRRAAFDEPAGYIELQMPLLMIKPRHELFSRPFDHPSRPIAWQKWGASEMKENVNRIVRVARVVVSPEFRGLGLAKQLLQTAIEFSRERWHVQGKRPLFLEISAEMLNHIDFVTSAGFQYIGSTQGNLSRITKDLRSMAKGQKINFGVMTLQNKYYQSFIATAEKMGSSFEELLGRLELALSNGGPSKFTPADWYLFRPVLRFPQRYYILGLDDYSQQYVKEGRKSEGREQALPPPQNNRIKANGLSVRSSYELEQSDSVRAILDCFGIATTTLSTTIVRPLDLEIGPGQVVLIAGASGSGKSVLLKALDPAFDEEHLKRTSRGELRLPPAGWIREISSDEPLIEYLSNRRDQTIQNACSCLVCTEGTGETVQEHSTNSCRRQ